MTSSSTIFLPFPRQIIENSGFFQLQYNKLIQIKATNPHDLHFCAEQIKTSLQENCAISWQITASHSISEDQIAVRLQIDPEVIKYQQGYCLTITPGRINIIAADAPGLFYGVQTLKQIFTQVENGQLRCLEIKDWPDFPVRGVMLDISRDKVYRMKTLLMLVDEFASWKINQLQLYTEHTFAYLGHEVVWQDSSPMTPEEILQLDRYCQERYIELVPNQNSFGHMSRWLKHTEYQHLAETLDPVQTPWGYVHKEPFSLAPVLPESIHFISSLYDQLLPNFSSQMINVGCDEIFDIGEGKSKHTVEEKGRGQVYLDYLLSIYADVRRRGVTMQFWGDIILQHRSLVPQLPKDIIALDWGYEADHPFEQETNIFKKANVPFYVCPGTSSWNSIGGRTDNMLENCRQASRNGIMNGATGFLNTDWGDNGHWQQLPISYPGLTMGAAYSWCLETNQNQDTGEILNTIVFADSSKYLGNILLDIGNEYKSWGLLIPNSSPIFWLLQESTESLQRFALEDLSPIQQSMERLAANLDELDKATPNRLDALLLKDEIRLTIRMMQHACKRALFTFKTESDIKPQCLLRVIAELIAEYKAAWLNRNRMGGLTDSLSRFDILHKEYKAFNG